MSERGEYYTLQGSYFSRLDKMLSPLRDIHCTHLQPMQASSKVCHGSLTVLH